jgi:signal peptidase I
MTNESNNIKNIYDSSDKKSKSNFRMIVRHIIYGILFVLFLITSIIHNDMIIRFSRITFKSEVLLPIILYISLSIVILLSLGMLLMIFLKARTENSFDKIFKIYNKIDIPRYIFMLISIVFFVVVFMITPCNVSGNSMNDTLENGNLLICSNMFYNPKKDDIVIFDSTKYNYMRESSIYVKRVIAIENDKISYSREFKILYVNDEIVDRNIDLNDYLNLSSQTINNYQLTTIVKKDTIIVFGDNRNDSYDSRSFGPINKKDVMGKVIFRIWPIGGITKKIKY